jgi:hypothetical protein
MEYQRSSSAQPMTILASLLKIQLIKQIFIIGTLLVLLTSCSNDTDDNQTTPLEGRWMLTNVSCFCAFGDNPDFSGHTLTFENNVLQVENAG